ncbi:MAG: hypothetical protein EBU97_06305 [Rhodobacteraceae bacterium]|nr:hypothetical protein [Paracoccaceae bacterium]
MSEPAKDDIVLLRLAGEAIRQVLIKPPYCMEGTGCELPPCGCSQEAGKAAIAAIRAAGWTVVPVALMEQAADELAENNSGAYPHRDLYPEEKRRYERDMELPNAIRAALEVKP